MLEKFRNYRFFYAMATLGGMIIGAGTFGIPYVMAKVGFGVGFFYLIILGLAVLGVHLFYGEIILRTEGQHRLVGYVGKYLGGWTKKLAAGIVLLEYYGSLLAYTILGGQFLAIIFGQWLGGAELVWALIFFALGAGIVFLGIKTVAEDEFFMVGLMFLTLAVLLAKGLPMIQPANFGGADFKNLFLPYGVILYALAGSAAIPEARQILRGQERKMKKAIIWGTIIPIFVYILFALVVVGISGRQTTDDAILGLIPYFGSWVVSLGAVFGILAVFTSFIALGLNLRDVFNQDCRIPVGGTLPSLITVKNQRYLVRVFPQKLYLFQREGSSAGGNGVVYPNCVHP